MTGCFELKGERRLASGFLGHPWYRMIGAIGCLAVL